MQIRPEELGAEESYKLLTGIVVPRPIAWITTLSATGSVNLAPFSAFTFVSPKPPMLAVSIGHKAGVYKDTAVNILRTEEYVVHIADQPLTGAVHGSAVEHPPHVSEAEVLGLETLPSEKVAPPRLAAAPIALECKFRHCMEFGETRSRLIVGEVVLIHLREGLVRAGKIDTRALNPICRIAGPNYATLGEIVTLAAIGQTPKS
ncbi:flavin reductase family protein [Xanthobacter tagetidis]|jgi:flavin reductase (DIM6/NTAB) family NADH-FMN oxidoreductase RutF|uniref:Flavin reductase family protein n=1 Tax=Xanthobacter tagetidis TaxID=60216 RepID=A0A3L7A1Z1_9HYPH|nr:flavin reductase family protein [Xanthobacter tagetidis]MBB6307202.1 flavin reductase (DIM6/NTAB) family NADH-FMN oxidoreductase RutF [Xanthobacter tagetidis]RLP74040.1 flavin reductase family protein [Xanthobacter tagetidis]